MSAGSVRAAPAMLHVVDGTARNGRIRRVEYVRRFFHAQAVVVGCLDDECRCAGIGLHAVGSTPKRALCTALAQTMDFERAHGEKPPLICAWSAGLACETALVFDRQLLIAEDPPPMDLDQELAARIEVIAPDSDIARAWSRMGVRRTRILPPCALAAGAPSNSVEDGAVSVALFIS